MSDTANIDPKPPDVKRRGYTNALPKITIRVDPFTMEQIRAIRRDSGFTTSQAIRTLIAIGAQREAALDATYKESIRREQAMEVGEKLRMLISKAIGDLVQQQLKE